MLIFFWGVSQDPTLREMKNLHAHKRNIIGILKKVWKIIKYTASACNNRLNRVVYITLVKYKAHESCLRFSLRKFLLLSGFRGKIKKIRLHWSVGTHHCCFLHNQLKFLLSVSFKLAKESMIQKKYLVYLGWVIERNKTTAWINVSQE